MNEPENLPVQGNPIQNWQPFSPAATGGGTATNFRIIPASQGIRRSESIATFAKALSAVQGKMGLAKKNVENDFTKKKYADLASVISTAKTELAAAGIAYTQSPGQNEKGDLYVDTLLFHTSGEWLEGRIVMHPIKFDAQSIGSLISYCKRYSLQAMLGMAAEDEDDDGERASAPKVWKMEGSTLQQDPTQPLSDDEKAKITASEAKLAEYLKALDEAKALKDLEKLAKTFQTRDMMTSDIATLRERYAEKLALVKGAA